MDRELVELLETLVEIDDISEIVYRRDDFGVKCFRHIDIECIYGDYIEIPEGDSKFKRMMDFFEITDLEKEEIVLFQA